MSEQQLIALVTGANRGIGLAITRQLAEQGIHVIGTARDVQQGKDMVETLTAQGLSVSTFVLDVSNAAQIAELATHIEEQYGRLDILINNAGIAPDQWVSGFDVDIALVREVMEVNVIAALALIQTFIPMMKERGYGRIVNMSSELASLGESQMGSTLAYRSSKAALNAVTKLLALELKDHPNILINAAAPGWVKTELGGPDAPRTPEEGADTPVWLATLPKGGPNGGFYRDRKPYPW